MSFYSEIKRSDLIAIWKQGFESKKYFLNCEDDKIWNTVEYEVTKGDMRNVTSVIRPWVYTNNPPDFHCEWYHDTGRLLGFIPTRCLNCWKVVVKPFTLQQLFNLYQLQLEMSSDDPTCYCKCGTEERPYVFGNYGGYFYTKSLEEGLERYKQVEELVHTKIASEIPVVLKRYCTEYEMDFGPSVVYKQLDSAAEWEQAMKEQFHMIDFPFVQPESVVKHMFHIWMKHAWNVGDPSIYIYTDGKPLVRPVCLYHELGDNPLAITQVGNVEQSTS